MLDFYITTFVALFVIIDPIGLLPMFIAITQGNTKLERRGIALRAIIIAAVVLTIFGQVGEVLLELIGIGMPAFRISGGLLLFLTAVEMLFDKRGPRREKQSEETENRPDPSVFPLATPLIAGPGSMTTMILFSGTAAPAGNAGLLVIAAMVSVLIIALILFLTASAIERMLGASGINILTRLFGMLLAALSVQFVVDGLKGLGAF